MSERYFAAVGDVHGNMFAMIGAVEREAEKAGIAPDFVLQAGDFQPVRHGDDLQTMSIPTKYKQLGDFPHFADGKAGFPWPVWFIGGNHEPYGYLDQYPQGAELVPNCHYLGRSGTRQINGLRIAWLSGHYHEEYFNSARPGLDEMHKRSNKEYTYYNQDDINALLEVEPHPDVLMMHDWPDSDAIAYPQHVDRQESGNTWGGDLVELLKPRIVLCGHMHTGCKTEYRSKAGEETHIYCLADLKNSGAVQLFAYGGEEGVRAL